MFGFFQKAENDMENLNKSMKHLGILKKWFGIPSYQMAIFDEEVNVIRLPISINQLHINIART